MLLSYNNGVTSVILRVKLLDSSSTTGAGLEGLTFNSAGLIIAAIADNEATTVAYTQAAGNIEDITTLGTFAAPTASKCRFKEVDATNHKGVYEIQLANARYAVTNARSLIVSISGATNLAQCDVLVQLTAVTPPTNFSLLAIDSNGKVQIDQAFPANFDALAIDASGRMTLGAVVTTTLQAAGTGGQNYGG